MSSPLVSISKRVIKVQPTFTADDNADNDVAFNWTEMPSAFSSKGQASTLKSVFMLNGYDQAHVIELVFATGNANGDLDVSTAKLGTGSDVVDISQAEAAAIGICGHVNITADRYDEGDLLTVRLAQNTDINLIMSPGLNSTKLYVGVYGEQTLLI